MLKLTFWIFLCALGRISCGQDGGQKMDVFRLPTTAIPESYGLQFFPHFNGTNSTFSGVTNITVTPIVTTNVITLNLKDLTVRNVTVKDITNQNPRDLRVNDFVTDTKNEQFEIRLQGNVIAKRRYLVTILYDGKIRTDMSGLYLSSYEENNVTKWLAVTHFEATDARKAFPCYDEPAYKATFNVSVIRQKNQIALSNMPIESVKAGPDNATQVVYFETTPLMSTYLMAIYVGEFVPNVNESVMTVYTHRDFINETEYVMSYAPEHLRVLEKYTGINYMLPKMDLLAIPDFKAGAMENWGLNTYREYFMLINDESKSISKIHSSEVVQHEFTHQWFGDLVTCSWWDYTWLNEGFARYFQYFATKMVRTSWPLEEMFVVNVHQVSLKYDQKPRHPITASVNTPDEIDNIFDTVTYSKAASVLRMLKYLVTERRFRLSLRNYLKDKMYDVATPTDLFSSFDNVLADESISIGNGLTVNDFMSNWTLQSGYPVLNIVKNKTSNTFSVTQSRFFINFTDEANSNETSAWYVGLTYTTETSKNFNCTEPSIWTKKDSNLTVLPAPKDSGWYIFNIQSIGFYRVNYDADNWMALTKQLNDTPTDIHVLNRAQLIDDSFNLARAGKLNYSVPLHLTKYLKKENSSIPWYSAKQGLSYLLQRMPRSEDGYEKFKAHVSKLAGIIFKKLDDSVSKNNTEFSVLSAWDTFASWACSLDNNYCTNRVLEYFNKWKAGEKISPDIKDAAFCVGVKNSQGSETFNRLFALFTNTTSISEKSSAESALGCSTNRTQLTEYINHILDGPRGPIKEKFYKSVVSAISVTPLGLDVLYEFLSTNLNRTLNELSDGEGVVKHIYSTLASKVTNDSEIEKLKKLKDNSTVPASVKSSFEKSFEVVNSNVFWFNTYSEGIRKWTLENGEKEEPAVTTTTMASTDKTTAGGSTKVTESSSASPATRATPTSTPKPSSAPSNKHISFTVLQLIVFTFFIKTLAHRL